MTKSLWTLIPRIEPREIKPFSPQFSLALESAQRFGFRYYKTWSYMNYLKWKDWVSWKELEARLNRIGLLEKENHSLEGEIRKLVEFSDYRLGRSILRPVRWLRRKLK